MPILPGDSIMTVAMILQYPDELSRFRFPDAPTWHRLVIDILDADPRNRDGTAALLPLEERASNLFLIVPP